MMEMDGDTDIISMVAADGWVAVYRDEGKYWSSLVVAWGIQKDGNVVGLGCSPDGMLMDVADTDNFVQLHHDKMWEEFPKEKVITE